MDIEANHRAEVVMYLPIAPSNRAAPFDRQALDVCQKTNKGEK
jgi:hypothetical protein